MANSFFTGFAETNILPGSTLIFKTVLPGKIEAAASNAFDKFVGLNNDAGSDGASAFADSADTSPNSPAEFSESHPATHTTKNRTPHKGTVGIFV